MSDDAKKTTNQKATSASTDVGQDEVQHTFDKATEKGYFGTVPDPTPNENYTVSGVTSGAPTPETDSKQAAKVAAHQRNLSRGEEV